MTNRITAEEARQLSGAASLTTVQALDQLDVIIKARAEVGDRSAQAAFLVSTLDEAEATEVAASLERRGYSVETEASGDYRAFSVRWD